ncbi:allophanate hydrolase [Lichenibacterium dinghuense]|uniref:allophanate hydrolase n=1 Tax=Lichenibacterium dinghuense TaxID=2895977 RepID=UPI001EFFEE6C|nr:allophanate hydrolase [Lichenibacterium sp. 6Y81]
MSPPLNRSALHAAYRDGLDPARVAEGCLAGAEAPEARGTFIALAPEAARAAVAALGPFDPVAKPLWGLPFAVKDNIDLAGLPTTAACPAFASTPERSATAVARLLAAGAVPVGKTNLDQFATGLVGVRSPYPPPLNSFDPAIVPGGSSSGSAVAVARGLATFALGTDTAGSGRVPAGLNNLVGLKPTLGAVPVRGVVPACQTLDCVSVFALTVEDAWAAASAMAGYDAEDPWSKRVALRAPGPVPPRLRAGVPDARSRRFFGDGNAERAFDRALKLYTGLGIDLVEVDFAPLFAVAALLYEGAWVAERYAAIRPFIAAHRDALHPTTARIILGAESLSAADAFAGIYRLAELRREAEPLWDGLDLLAVPTVPRAYRVAELDADPIGPNAALGTYTNFVNLLDLCALAVPGPFRDDGFPSGTTLVAPAGRDGLLAAVGAALHRAAGVPMGATGHPLPPGPAAAGAGGAPAGEVELVVIGAHLSGMPLNRDLVALGGTFRRAVDTRPEYRLHALPGGPPARPGLLRVGDGGGAVAAEVWSLPPDGFGRFVDTVPPPLCIGRVRLADGTAPAGFLCEPAGLAGARDITHLGGWRAFVAGG